MYVYCSVSEIEIAFKLEMQTYKQCTKNNK